LALTEWGDPGYNREFSMIWDRFSGTDLVPVALACWYVSICNDRTNNESLSNRHIHTVTVSMYKGKFSSPSPLFLYYIKLTFKEFINEA
jgi:hypothetical protein